MVSEHHVPEVRAVGFRPSTAAPAGRQGGTRRVDDEDESQSLPVLLQPTGRAQDASRRRLFGRQKVEDAVWMAFAHAMPTRSEVVRVARRRGAPSELVRLLDRLPSSEFAQLSDVWQEVEAVQDQRQW